jgi:diaminopimelate decarboxylase
MEWKGKICIEMGRALSAMCGSYLTRVMDKKTSDGRGYLITDGGIHQIGYDGQIKGMYEPWIRQIPDRKDATSEWTVCGSLCTVNDILVQSCRLNGIEEGDVLSFDQAGAYCAMEGMSLFLSHELPQVVLCSREEGFRSVRERMETFELNSPERAERK